MPFSAMPGFIVGFLITAAYWPGISGAMTTPRWIIGALVFPTVLFCRQIPIKVTIAHLFGALFVAWALLTFVWSEHREDTIGDGWQLLVLVSAFCAGSLLEKPLPVYLGAAAGLLVSDGFAAAQITGWVGPLQANVPAGLFLNRNFFAEMSALVAVALIAERIWWAIPVAAPGLLLTNARGAILGFLCVLVLMMWKRSRWGVVFLIIVIAASMLAVTFSGNKIATLNERFQLWDAATAILRWKGYGLGTFYESSPYLSGHDYRFEHAHNEFLDAAFETGLIGAALLVAFFASLLVGPLSTERLVLIALLIEACFENPLHKPSTAILGCLVAGHLSRSLCGVGDAVGYGRARIRLGVWAGDIARAGRAASRAGRRIISVRSSVS